MRLSPSRAVPALILTGAFSLAAPLVRAETKAAPPKTQPTATVSSISTQPSVLVDPRPDLYVEINVIDPPYIFPVTLVVRNKGRSHAGLSHVRLTCTAYKGNTVWGPCLSPIERSISGIAANSYAYPQMPYGGTGLLCDRKDPNTNKMIGLTRCELEAEADFKHEVDESNENNNKTKKVVTVP